MQRVMPAVFLVGSERCSRCRRAPGWEESGDSTELVSSGRVPLEHSIFCRSARAVSASNLVAHLASLDCSRTNQIAQPGFNRIQCVVMI